MVTPLRCDSSLYGLLSDDHSTLEVKCKRRACGAAPGVVVLHTIDLEAGKVTRTQRFKEPQTRKE